MFKILSVNAGSSSLKFKLYNMPEEKEICSGIADRIGHEDGIFKIESAHGEKKTILPIMNHEVAVQLLLKALIEEKIVENLNEIQGVGHRIVQGGKYFHDSALFDKDTEQKIESLIPLAPLHNAAHLVGFRAFQKVLPEVGNVAVFDTAFHQTMEPTDYIYPIPYEYYEKHAIRRYGAHGTSHKYLAEKSVAYVGEHARVITCHLGSGASLCAIKDGKCVATSMGLTPLGGIMMGTRCGDIDPSIISFIMKQENLSVDEMDTILNKKSGFLGVSGVSNDSRDVLKALEAGNPRAKLADDLFIRRVADFIGQYFVRLGGCDLIIFSAGIGENVGYYRKRICDEIAGALHVKLLDSQMTLRGEEALISTDDSAIKVAVIPTNEELMIARDTVRLLHLK